MTCLILDDAISRCVWFLVAKSSTELCNSCLAGMMGNVTGEVGIGKQLSYLLNRD